MCGLFHITNKYINITNCSVIGYINIEYYHWTAMKPADFIKEDHNIVQAVVEMHDDHEIQMAREQCYNAASNAIELHRMLKNISERQGLEGWVQEKITLANDYLRQVKEWMEYEMMDRLDRGSNMGETASAGAGGAASVATAPAGVKKMQRRMPY
jgi:hypothetical protein